MTSQAAATDGAGIDPARDYPLGSRRPELLQTPTGKSLDDLTMQAVVAGEIQPEDLRITPRTLRMQAEVARGANRRQLAENFSRAAELATLPDDKVLDIYNALRPNASSRARLMAIADELESDAGASICAALVREAAEVYQRRGLLADETDAEGA